MLNSGQTMNSFDSQLLELIHLSDRREIVPLSAIRQLQDLQILQLPLWDCRAIVVDYAQMSEKGRRFKALDHVCIMRMLLVVKFREAPFQDETVEVLFDRQVGLSSILSAEGVLQLGYPKLPPELQILHLRQPAAVFGPHDEPGQRLQRLEPSDPRRR